MVVQQEILRLKTLGIRQRKVAKILGISRDSVKKYWNGIVDETPNVGPPSWVLSLDWEHIKKEIERSVPRKILYQELQQLHALPAYSNFCRYIKIKFSNENSPKITIRIVRQPGDSLEVDYAGDTVPILNPSTGEIIEAQLFVAAMSYSSYFYAEFTLTQQQEDFIGSHNRMFYYFGGVPKYLIPDNCKTAVTKSERYDPVINHTYQDMCVHYNVAVDPADPASPKHKPNVERTVGILQQDFLQRIRNKTYTSLGELNRDLHDYLRGKQQEIIKERGKSRAQLFEEEKLFLRPLPAFPYEIFYFKKANVHPDCHIQHNKNFFSVPYIHVGKEVCVRYNQNMIYIYVNTECVAMHSTPKTQGHYYTNEKHYPEKQIVDLHMNILALKSEAERYGPNLAQLVDRLFREEQFPLKKLRKVQGILELAKKFEKVAMEEAAETALIHNRLQYYFIKKCAENYRPPKSMNIYKAPARQLELICITGGNHE